MVGRNGAWTRQPFLVSAREAWKRSDLNQRQYCGPEEIPLKAFGNWPAIFKTEPQPAERKLLHQRRGSSHHKPLSMPQRVEPQAAQDDET